MNSKMIKKIRFYPMWKEEKEIKWLENMSLQGWHLMKRGYLTYCFEKGERQEYIYSYDYKLTTAKDYDEYRQIFEDIGWEHIVAYANWHYFRCKKGEKPQEMYNNVESKIGRLKRILRVMVFLAELILLFFLTTY